MEGFSIKKDLEKNFNDYRNLLTNYLKKRYYQDLSDEDIDDIVSNTFVKALRFEDKYVYEGSGGLRSWLVTIAKNSALNLLHSSKEQINDLEKMKVSIIHLAKALKVRTTESGESKTINELLTCILELNNLGELVVD